MKPKYALVGVAALSLILGGCTSAQDTQQGAAQSAGSGGASKTIGLITFSGTDPSANIVVSSAKKKAQEAGYKVIVVDAQGQVDQANTAMQNPSSRSAVPRFARSLAP